MTPVIRDSSSSTYALAHFLATTGPEERPPRRDSTSSQGQSSTTSMTGSTQSRLASRLRSKWLPSKKQNSPMTIGSPTNVYKPKHTPLMSAPPDWLNSGHSNTSNTTNSTSSNVNNVSHLRKTPTASLRGDQSQTQPQAKPQSQTQTQTHQRDSGIYSTDEYTKQSQSSLNLVSFPPPPPKKRVRHVQTQTPAEENSDDKDAEHDDDELCHHCHRPVPQKLLQRRHRRRLSSPAALPTQIKKNSAANGAMTTDEAKLLLGMIETLKLQLKEEQRSRQELEKSLHDKRV